MRCCIPHGGCYIRTPGARDEVIAMILESETKNCQLRLLLIVIFRYVAYVTMYCTLYLLNNNAVINWCTTLLCYWLH